MAEGEEEGFRTQLGEDTLDVHIVGAPSLDLRAVICQPGHHGAFVERAAQSLTVGVQNADVPAVAAQGVQDIHPGRRHRPETARREVTAGGDQKIKRQTVSVLVSHMLSLW